MTALLKESTLRKGDAGNLTQAAETLAASLTESVVLSVEDLKVLWELVKERFASSKPMNFSDDMFEKPDVQAKMILLVEKKYPLTRFTLDQMLNNVRLEIKEESKVSLELLRFMILLVEKRYPLTRFTLDQMLNNVRLEVKEESKVSLELLRFTYCCQYKLMLLDDAAELRLLEQIQVVSAVKIVKTVNIKDVADIAKEVAVEKDAEMEENADVQEVVTAASATITAATNPILAAPSTSRRRKGVVIEQVQRKEKEDNVVMRYQALKRKPQTKAQSRKNMMIYLRNMAGFKMDYFKGMSYDDIRLIFEKKFNSNVAFLVKTKEQMEEEDIKALKRTSERQAEKATKKQKLDEEVVEIKKHLQIVPNDDDDVYTVLHLFLA
nr:hypothetical protein [Tanacetum cinerariifolium]